MKPKSNLPQRRSMRLRDYDYSQPGAYFVSICVQHRKCLFGTIIDGKMQLNKIGQIVVECWNHIPQHFPSVELVDYVIMPNHMHGIIAWNITDTGTPYAPESAPNRRGKITPPTSTSESAPNRRGEVTSPALASESAPNRRGKVTSPALGKIMAYFKYQSTKRINQYYNRAPTRIWQRNYHDHVIRDDKDLQRLHQYIQENPMKWSLDQLHPDNPSRW